MIPCRLQARQHFKELPHLLHRAKDAGAQEVFNINSITVGNKLR